MPEEMTFAEEEPYVDTAEFLSEEAPAVTEEAPAAERGRPARRRAAPAAEEEPPRRKGKKRKKKGHGGLVAVIALAVLLVLMAGGAVAAGMAVSRIDTIYPGVHAEGIDLSGMTRQEAAAALQALGRERYDGYAVTASLPLDNSLTITAEEAGVGCSADRLAEDAWSYGRSDGMLMNLVQYAQARYLGANTFSPAAGLEVWMDESAVRAIVHAAAVDIDEQLLESGVDITDTEIRLMKGASGLTLDEEAVFQQFRDAILSADRAGFTYESVPQADEEYDFPALYDQLHAEMVNARIVYAPEYAALYAPPAGTESAPEGTESTAGAEKSDIVPALTDPQPGDEELDFQDRPFLVTESSVGVTFDVAEAERLWAAASYGDTVVVPLTVTPPETSTEEINELLFRDALSKNWTMVRLWNRDYCEEVRTSLSGSSNNRISNVKKACELLNGTMLMPGQTFSYNDALGERTEENGWLPAPAYANGEVRQEAGGGICQVSSTLYNAALYSNLEIVERECHQFQVGYLPWGMDATVSWGWPDFKFRNDKPYPIMIVAWVDDETNECCVQIKGTDTEHEYVIMRFNNWEVYDQTDTYHDADGNPLAVGMAAATWRLVFHDGDDYSTATPISEEYEVYSTYHYHTEDIEARNVPLPAADEG